MNQFLDKIHFKTICAVIIIGAIYIALQGCAITATIQLPNGELAIYTGPQKAKMLLEEKGRKVEYSGISDPWYAPFLAIFAGAASRAAQDSGETNITLNP